SGLAPADHVRTRTGQLGRAELAGCCRLSAQADQGEQTQDEVQHGHVRLQPDTPFQRNVARFAVEFENVRHATVRTELSPPRADGETGNAAPRSTFARR